MRNPILLLFLPFLLLSPSSPSSVALAAAAADLRCANLDVPRFRITLDANLTLAPGNGDWCCPETHPLHGISFQSKWPNPSEYHYADASGVLYSKLPACFGCSYEEHVCADSGLTGGALFNPNNYVCCPLNSTCGAGDRKCYGSGTSPDGRNLAVMNANTHIVEVAAVPVANFDLCQSGLVQPLRLNLNTTVPIQSINAAPCAAIFKCEAFSQSQFRCTTCADARYSPPGVCKTFTCPSGRFCSNMTNAYGAAPFKVSDAPCPAGSYCPMNSTQPIPCRSFAGEYCPTAGMSAPENCNSWTGVATYCPVDSMNKVPCPAGYYCAAFSLPHPCPSAEFSDVEGAFQCQSCGTWYTSDSGATKCSKLKPLPIALICLGVLLCIASAYLVWLALRRRRLQPPVNWEADKEAAENRQKVIAAHEAQMAVAAANVLENKRKKAEALRFQFLKECARIKAGVLERFMADFRVELARYAQSLSLIADEQPEGETAVEMEQEGQTPAMAISIDDDVLRSYEQFVFESLSREFDSIATPASQVIRFMTEQPESVCPRDFDQKMKHIYPLILEAFSDFIKMKRATDASTSTAECAQANDAKKQPDTLSQIWAQELQQHMSLWLKQHGVAKKYSPSSSYNRSAAVEPESEATSVEPPSTAVSKACRSVSCSGKWTLFRPLPPTYRPTLFPLSDEGAAASNVRRTRLPRSANSSPQLLESSTGSGSATPRTPASAPVATFSLSSPSPKSPSPPKKGPSFVQIDEIVEEVHSEPHSLTSVRVHLYSD